jgi:magnesium chelatase family protein
MNDLLRYRRKLSGPLLDRIDIALHVNAISYDKLAAGGGAAESETIREKVVAARARAYARAKAFGIKEKPNGSIQAKEIQKLAGLTPEVEKVLNESAERLAFSARAYHRTQKLARTIADIEGSEEITRDHILEAIRYRPQLESLS